MAKNPYKPFGISGNGTVSSGTIDVDSPNECFAWRPLEVGIRLLRWCTHFSYFKDARCYKPGFLLEFLRAYHQNATVLMSSFSPSGNHLIHQSSGIIRAGICFPEFKDAISTSPSPMITTARLIKRSDPTAKVVFIGPCAAKKFEYTLEKTGGMIDSVMSFEELQAFLDARGIDTTQCEDTFLDNASFYGRIFAKSGGIAQGVAHVAEKFGIEGVKPVVMNGIDQCRQHLALLRAKKETANFFEGMACDGGCVGGPLSITRSPKNVFDVDQYGNSAKEKDIDGSVALYQMTLSE